MEMLCFYTKAKALYLPFQKWTQLGISGYDLFATLFQNSTTWIFVCMQRILWRTVSWTWESTRRAVHKGKSKFARTIWYFWIRARKYVLLFVKVFAIDCSNVEFCTHCLSFLQSKVQRWIYVYKQSVLCSVLITCGEKMINIDAVFCFTLVAFVTCSWTAAYVLQIQYIRVSGSNRSAWSFAFSESVSVSYWLMTLLTVFIIALEVEAYDYEKGCYISDAYLWCSANHKALGQLANQSTLSFTEGSAL